MYALITTTLCLVYYYVLTTATTVRAALPLSSGRSGTTHRRSNGKYASKSILTKDCQQGARYIMAVFAVLNFILMVIRVKSTQTSPPAGDCIVATIYGGVIGCIRVRLVRTKLNRDLNLTPTLFLRFCRVFDVVALRATYTPPTVGQHCIVGNGILSRVFLGLNINACSIIR